MGVFRPCVNRMVSRQMCCKEIRDLRDGNDWVGRWRGKVCGGGGGEGEKGEDYGEKSRIVELRIISRGDFISCNSLLLERSLLLFYRGIIFAMSARQLYTSRPDQHNGASLPRKMREK